MTDTNIEQLKEDIELLRDVMSIFLDKSGIHNKKLLLMKLYNVDDLGKMIGRLNQTYNTLELE